MFLNAIDAISIRAEDSEKQEVIRPFSDVSQANEVVEGPREGRLSNDLVPNLREVSADSFHVTQYDIQDEDTSGTMDVEDLPLIRKFMFGSDTDFQWLIRRLEVAAGMISTGTTEAFICDSLITMIGSSTSFTLELDWDPVNFMSDQYGATECCLQKVICLCGVGAAVQALSCEEYTNKVWPSLGSELLRCASTAIQAGFGVHKSMELTCLLDPASC